MPMLMYTAGLEVYILIQDLTNIHTLCLRAAKALVSLNICAGSSKSRLQTDVTSTVIHSHVLSHMLWVILVTSQKTL